MKNLDEKIVQDILEGILQPTKKLTIKALSQRYGCGPTPIREALSRLEKTGLIGREENRGFFVPSLAEEELIDLQNTFAQIECLALGQAISRKEAEWESKVVATLYQLSKVESQSVVSYTQWMEKNEAFHRALVQGCASKALMDLREQLFTKLKRYIYLAFQLNKEKLQVNHDEHQKIAEKALSGQSDQALELLEYHILGALPELTEFLKSQGCFK